MDPSCSYKTNIVSHTHVTNLEYMPSYEKYYLHLVNIAISEQSCKNYWDNAHVSWKDPINIIEELEAYMVSIRASVMFLNVLNKSRLTSLKSMLVDVYVKMCASKLLK